MRIIAVDFDGTLCRCAWPAIGPPRRRVIRRLLRAQRKGAKIILWTCRSGLRLSAAVNWCNSHGVHFDAVNENLPDVLEQYGGADSRKVTATEYWDDKAVRP